MELCRSTRELTGKVDDADVDDELSDLHRGEVLLPLGGQREDLKRQKRDSPRSWLHQRSRSSSSLI